MEMCSKSEIDKKVMDGLEMFSIQFSDMLAKEGLKEIEAMGKKIRPELSGSYDESEHSRQRR